MLSLGILLAIPIFGHFHLASTTNYCDPKLCTVNRQVKNHIGCNHSGQFSNNCIEPSMIPVTPQLQKAILFSHNDFRNKLANGTLPRFQSAKRMTQLTWDTELEYLAGLNVMSCVIEHDECHNTPAYKYSGQNLAIQYQSTSILAPTYEKIIVFLITEWFNEQKDTNQNDMDKCSSSGLSKGIGHFTAMMQEKTSKVGCSIAKYLKVLSGKQWNAFLLACNYSFTNMIDMPIYVKGRMCSACRTGCSSEFNGLCSISENVPPIHDLDEQPEQAAAPVLTIPTVRPIQRVPSPRVVKNENQQLNRPPPPPVPSARLKELMRTAETVVRPFEPGQTLFIRDEPNPAIRNNEIIRPIPIVTWRGPRVEVPIIRSQCSFPNFTRF